MSDGLLVFTVPVMHVLTVMN